MVPIPSPTSPFGSMTSRPRIAIALMRAPQMNKNMNLLVSDSKRQLGSIATPV